MQTQEDVILAVDGKRGFLGVKTNRKYLLIKAYVFSEIKYAEAGIRTPTSLRTLGPEPNASANSATSARSVITLETRWYIC